MTLILLLLPLTSLSAFSVQDSTISVTAVYEAVLGHAAYNYPSRPGVGVVISDRSSKFQCQPHCVDTTSITRNIDPEVVQELRDKGSIQGFCTKEMGTIGCSGQHGRTFMCLGIPYRTPATLLVRMGEGPPAAILKTPGSDDPTEPVDVGIDVLVYGPCPLEHSPCEYPAIATF